MYNGVGSGLGWDLTGGTSNLNAWSHVVATWNGSAATLYVNGVLADNTNDPAATGVYNASNAADLILAATDTGSPYAGSVDETAFYGSALTPLQVLNHFNAASSGTAGAYHSLVRSDGALLQLSNNARPRTGDGRADGGGGYALARPPGLTPAKAARRSTIESVLNVGLPISRARGSPRGRGVARRYRNSRLTPAYTCGLG